MSGLVRYSEPRARRAGAAFGSAGASRCLACQPLSALRTDVRSRDTGGMPMSVEQIESLRRSNAMGSLPASQVAELLETAAERAPTT
jgi:hypothetical protein